MKHFLIFFTFSLSLSAIDFNRDIKPVLARKCYSCHGPKKQKGKLRLDNRKDALKVLTEIDGSIKLLSRINHQDPDEIMPPPEEGKLSIEEKKLLQQWLQEGARYQKHWSFEDIKQNFPQNIKNPWISNGIDSFILKKLNELKLNPQPVIFEHNLLRRASFKITGLPPSPEDLDLLNQGSLNYRDYTKKLLESVSYGEHMATFWLDGARYADTNGIEYDNSRPIWPYRDWVINAFNSNMPYNQFIIEQLAGDLLPDSSLSQKIATGFLRCNVTTNEAGSIEEEFQVRYAKDRLNTTMSAITGLTVACAECHDHKFDPISQKEYYQLLAYFNNLEGKAVGQPNKPANEPLVLTDADKNQLFIDLKAEKSSIEKKIISIREKNLNQFKEWHKANLTVPSKALYLLNQFELFFSFDETEDDDEVLNIIDDNKGQLRGPILKVDGKHEQALKCTGAFYVDCPKTSLYDQDSKFSAGFWLRPDKDESSGEVLGQFYDVKGWKIEVIDGVIQFHLSNSKESALKVQSKDKLPRDIWKHVTVTYDGSNTPQGVKFYINGEEKESVVTQQSLKGSTTLNAILRVGLFLENVTIDDVFITKNILTQNEIQIISNFKAASRLVHYKPSDLSSRNLKRLENYYFQNQQATSAQLFKESEKVINDIYLLKKYSNQSLVVIEKAGINETHILLKGDYQDKGEKVNRRTPEFLSKLPLPKPNNRLGLAKWLTDKDNPLTARIIVNRIWHKLFDRGLFKTLDDIGIQGTYPTHPELLDFLSTYLIKNDWDIKKLVSLIINSSTFKQQALPGNMFSHYNSYPKHRLSAEEIRDQVLYFSSFLNSKLGGPPVFPYQPPGLWYEITADGSDTKTFIQSKGSDNFRRSIYTFWKRSLPPPSMSIFDAPNRQTCTLSRQTTNTPLQSLSLMNDPQFTELYDAILKQTQSFKSYKEKINFIFNKLLYRAPNTKEILLSQKITSEKDLQIFIHALTNTDEFITIK
ncbi:MAG: DUF1553 domain-containing protein [Lentisphaeraceae bacterium]|nr:DUF1553 domain-containing protein [Lentisphaeraceae bacterium]